MKRILAIVITLLILASIAVLPASAATKAETKVTAKKGDEVIYSLNLTVPERVVGCDLSIYYDSEQFKPIASADFTGSYNVDDQQAFLNHNLKGEAKCVFSILNGVDFKTEKPIFSLKLKAQNDLKDAHITYYVRYLYPLDKDPDAKIEQFKEYKFTCDVTVAGKKVTDSKAPQLNTEDYQDQGLFINSVTGDGKDADVNMADKEDHLTNGGDKNENNNNNNNSGTADKKDDNKSDNKKPTSANNSGSDSKDKNDDKTENNTSVSNNGGVDAPQSTSVATTDSTIDSTGDSGSVFTSVWFWIVVGAIVIAAGAGAFVVIKKKKQ